MTLWSGRKPKPALWDEQELIDKEVIGLQELTPGSRVGGGGLALSIPMLRQHVILSLNLGPSTLVGVKQAHTHVELTASHTLSFLTFVSLSLLSMASLGHRGTGAMGEDSRGLVFPCQGTLLTIFCVLCSRSHRT